MASGESTERNGVNGFCVQFERIVSGESTTELATVLGIRMSVVLGLDSSNETANTFPTTDSLSRPSTARLSDGTKSTTDGPDFTTSVADGSASRQPNCQAHGFRTKRPSSRRSETAWSNGAGSLVSAGYATTRSSH